MLVSLFSSLLIFYLYLSLSLYTGTGGHASFGGHGYSSRKFGLLLDTVVSAEVVLADGSIITANGTNNETSDVFWAIRGAGPSFGIVTSWTFQTIPAQNATGYTIIWNRNLTQDEFQTTYSAFQDFCQTAPPIDLGIDGFIFGGPGKAINISFIGLWYGEDSAFPSVIQPFLDQLPPGYKFEYQVYDWIDGLRFAYNNKTLDTTEPDTTDTFFVKSLQTKEPHTQDALQSFANFLYTTGVDPNNASSNWFITFDCEYYTLARLPSSIS
jgi:hypothetical protein